MVVSLEKVHDADFTPARPEEVDGAFCRGETAESEEWDYAGGDTNSPS
jgi:hypothetical protein